MVFCTVTTFCLIRNKHIQQNNASLLNTHPYMSRIARNPVFGVSNPVRHKLCCTASEDASRLKFWIEKLEGLGYLCSENKGVDQLRNYRASDLHLCFHICKKGGSLMTQLMDLTGLKPINLCTAYQPQTSTLACRKIHYTIQPANN